MHQGDNTDDELNCITKFYQNQRRNDIWLKELTQKLHSRALRGSRLHS